MNKQLLLLSTVWMSLTAFSQTGNPKPLIGAENTAKKIEGRLAAETRRTESGAPASNVSTPQNMESEDAPTASKTTSFVSNWTTISSSMNAYGVSVANTRPLQYNEELNAVTFIHRKSPTYVASPVPLPAAESGVIVGMVTQNWGANWDSTCLWNDNTNFARYPQGAVVLPSGNLDINNAKLVGVAAINAQPTGWVGNAFYSKSMGQSNYTNVAPATGSFFPTLSATLGKADFTIYDFQAMDDGKVVTLGYVNNDPNGNTAAIFGYRGARVIKGNFVSGNMIWTHDSIIPDVASTGAGSKYLISRPRMAWSEDGMVGYVIHIGVSSTSTVNNRGFQPIIHRTVDGGVSWAPVAGVDFNLPAMSTVTNMVLSPRSNSNVTIPFFDYTEGLGLTVDKDNKLHIAAILRGTFSSDPDSLGFTFAFTHADGETYSYRHSPGFRPYLYDFTGDGLPNSAWKVTLIDSLSSESPGTSAATDPNGFNTNPWVLDDGSKISVEARVQCSRTPDGKYIVYTWTESDTTVTTTGAGGLGMKWNELPNIKARLMDVTAQSIHSLEINVTKPGSYPYIVSNNNVSSRAYLHYASPKCAMAQTMAVSPSGPALVLPMTSSRPYGTPLVANTTIIHRYTSALLNFGSLSQDDIYLPIAPAVGGFNENAFNSANTSYVYPNPAKESAQLAIDLKDNSKVEVAVSNLMGQVMKTSLTNAALGQNDVPIDLTGLSKGVYMIHVKIADANSTKKLIVE